MCTSQNMVHILLSGDSIPGSRENQVGISRNCKAERAGG